MTDMTQGHQPEESKQQGIRCPWCGSRHLPVSYTRHRNQRIVRVRKCSHCDRRVTTYEKVFG